MATQQADEQGEVGCAALAGDALQVYHDGSVLKKFGCLFNLLAQRLGKRLLIRAEGLEHRERESTSLQLDAGGHGGLLRWLSRHSRARLYFGPIAPRPEIGSRCRVGGG